MKELSVNVFWLTQKKGTKVCPVTYIYHSLYKNIYTYMYLVVGKNVYTHKGAAIKKKHTHTFSFAFESPGYGDFKTVFWDVYFSRNSDFKVSLDVIFFFLNLALALIEFFSGGTRKFFTETQIFSGGACVLKLNFSSNKVVWRVKRRVLEH